MSEGTKGAESQKERRVKRSREIKGAEKQKERRKKGTVKQKERKKWSGETIAAEKEKER